MPLVRRERDDLGIVSNNIQMKGTMSQIFDTGRSFYFIIKKGKLFVIVFFDILRHRSLHIYPGNSW